MYNNNITVSPESRENYCDISYLSKQSYKKIKKNQNNKETQLEF